jgi:hypothetical protein
MKKIVNRCCGPRMALSTLCVIAVLACAPASPLLAGVQDSKFVISPDGSNVAFELRDVSRRDVFMRLFASRAIELEWADPAVADEAISGSFTGSPDLVLQRLLKPLDFLIVHSLNGNKSSISRVTIFGKAGSRSNSAIIAQVGNTAAPPVPGESMVPIPAPGPRVAATLVPVPPAPGASMMPTNAPAPVTSLVPVLPAPGESSMMPIAAPTPGVAAPAAVGPRTE